MEQLDTILFYTLDKTIRSYRQFAQRELKKAGYSITIDQWLIIRAIMENPEVTQNELGNQVFKDNASVTRIISLLVKARYLKRDQHIDRRRTRLVVTATGKKIIQQVQKVVLRNRAAALKNISKTHITITGEVLQHITRNCNLKTNA